MFSDISEVLEDFRLYCLSYWSDLYLIQNYLSPSNLISVASECLERKWLILSRQTMFVQIYVIVTVLSLLSLLTVKIWVMLTTGRCRSKARLDGKTVLVTGANVGIGYETARDLSSRGARLILGCRNMPKGIAAAESIMKATGNKNITVKEIDLSSMSTVRQFAREFMETEKRLDILILNAGVALTKKYMTEENLELHMAANYFGHFLLTNLLMPLMIKSAAGRKKTGSSAKNDPGRIVALSSVGHWWGRVDLDNLNSERYYDSSRIYGTTKLCDILLAKEIARRTEDLNIVANAVHPGAVATELFRNIPFMGPIIQWGTAMLFKTAEQGAQTSIYCAVDEQAGQVSGKYFADCKVAKSSADSNDPKLALQLWNKSAEILEMEDFEIVI